MNQDLRLIDACYTKLKSRTESAKKIFARPLTLTEKILSGHMTEELNAVPVRGKTYVNLTPDRVAMQDATAQMALLQFMLAGRKTTAVPSTVHCDHLIIARKGSEEDLKNALKENEEVYGFLSSVSKKFGIGFYPPGAGIIHQLLFENHAFPGGMVIGTDSHTPNSGGLGMIGIGVGGADAVDAMVGMPWELKWPKIIGVKLTGKLQGFASAKDVILKLLGILTVKGGTGAILEYFGEGTHSLSATGKATITNMGAELGATSSVFPLDDKIHDYLMATNRPEAASKAVTMASFLKADPEVEGNPQNFFDKVIEINLTELEPHLAGPFTPDLVRPISAFGKETAAGKFPVELKAGLIGSCTNSSYEDLSRVASILKDAVNKGLKPKALLYVSPGSEMIHDTIERDGILETLKACGAVILANACGPCIGQWDRQDLKDPVPNSIITSFNRNFKARNDGNPETLAFIGSPEFIAAAVFAGRIDFNPSQEFLSNEKGEKVKLSLPQGEELPLKNFSPTKSGDFAPQDSSIKVIINPSSKRLSELTPFSAWDGNDSASDCLVLLKISGKCTTDHISPAGKWLKFRGHLNNISDNLFLGAVNAFTGETGKGTNQLTGEKGKTLSEIARHYQSQNRSWIAVGDENYGEGSSREHAAMEPRHLGCRAIIARSFARIAENNLKKQGILVATFADPSDYNKIREDDSVTLKGIKSLAPGSPLTLEIKHRDGNTETVTLNHTFSEYQVEWFKAGSALNLIQRS